MLEIYSFPYAASQIPHLKQYGFYNYEIVIDKIFFSVSVLNYICIVFFYRNGDIAIGIFAKKMT